MKLELHADAKMNFDKEADDLLLELTPSKSTPNQPASAVSFSPDVVAKANIPFEDILELTSSITDPVGRTLARYFQHNDKEMGLGEDAYRKLVRLCEKLHRVKSVRDLVSYSTIEETAFNWMAARYRGETSGTMTDFVFSHCEVILAEFTAWIPVAAMYIQSELPVGKVILRAFDSEFFEQLGAHTDTDDPNRAAQMEDWILGMRQKYQGRAAVTLTRFGEQKRVVEIAQEEGERALAMLRFFSHSTVIPGKVSYCCLEGREKYRNEHIFRKCKWALRVW